MSRSSSAILELPTGDDLPLYDQLKEAIRQRVREGHWAPGDRIPTVRKLSQDLGIAFTTVARGVRELVQEGVLESNLGGGTRVAMRKTQRLGTIGILGYASANEIERSSACNRHLLRLLQEHVIATGHTVVYDHHRPDMPVGAMFRDMTLIDGLLLLGHRHDPQGLIQLTQRGVPIVWVADSCETRIASINSANMEDTLRATRLLLKRGHRRIAIIDSPSTARDPGRPTRLMGYRHAMAQSNVGFHPEWVIQDLLAEDQAAHLRAIDPAPTAVICTNAGHFRTLHRLLKGSPVEPGNPLEVCVYDDDVWHTVEPLGINYLRVEQPWQQMAESALQLLIEFIETGRYEPRQHELSGRIVHVSAEGLVEPV